jgi:bromodomain-containing factor 1
LTKTVDISPSSDFASPNIPEVNGMNNSQAFSSNQAIDTNFIHSPVESQPTENFSETAPTSSPLQDTNTTTADVPEEQDNSSFLASTQAAIDSALDDVAGSSTVPPVVEAQESDLRDTNSALLLADSTQGQAQEPTLNDDLQPESAQMLPQGNDAGFAGAPAPENNLNAESVPAPSQENEELQATMDLAFEQPAISVPPPSDNQPQQSTTNFDSSAPSQPEIQDTTFAAKVDQTDTEMADVSQFPPPSKIAREREDDDENEPAAKRTKTEGVATDTNPPAPIQNGESSFAQGAVGILPYEVKEIVKIVKNVARTQAGKNFRLPVKTLWPTVAEQYAEKIPNQIDFDTMEQKLKQNLYPTLDDFKADVELIYTNALAFNGADHTVTNAAIEARDAVLNRIASIPPEPVAQPKKDKKAKRSTPTAEAGPRASAGRRQSRGSHPAAVAATPTVAAPAQTFALDPSTSTPLIRRDSTKGDGGRPKREIHPPKNKDLVYSVRPKSKKFATELKFCEEVLAEMQKPKYAAFSGPFSIPVDPVALNIPNYFTVIKKPMDLSTVANKLKEGSYGSANDFEKDVKQIFINCYKFNPAGNHVNILGHQFEEVFNLAWAKKDQWIADHSPAAASPASNPDSEEEEESEAEAPEQPPATSAAAARLIEEQAKLITLMSAKNADQALIQMQQDMVQIVQKRVLEEEQLAKKKVKKPKPAKPVKKAPAPKKAAPSKKSGSSRQSTKYLGTMEKEVISAGLYSLPDEVTNNVLEMIKEDLPEADVSCILTLTAGTLLTTAQVGDDGTLELDIDLISTPLLWKIHGLILQYAPDVEAQIKKQFQEREPPRPVAKPATKKKNKPMNKHEQDRKIDQLRGSLNNFERQSSGSQEPVIPSKPSNVLSICRNPNVVLAVEKQEESSGDEESEEED